MKVEGKSRQVDKLYFTSIFCLKGRISESLITQINAPVFLFFSFLIGHVFPEFKESDAMFAAERVRYFVFLVSLKLRSG